MANKHPAASEAGDGPPSKVPRLSIPMSPEAEELLNSMSPSEIDLHITTESWGNGICDQTTLKLAEAACIHRPVLPFAESQFTILQARHQYSDTMNNFLLEQQAAYHKLSKDATFKAAASLLPLAFHPAVDQRQNLKDAILYRVGFLVMDKAFEQNSCKQAKKVLGQLPSQSSVEELFKDMANASKRHLERPEDRSVLWPQPPQVFSRLSTSTQLPPPASTMFLPSSPPKRLGSPSKTLLPSSPAKQLAEEESAELEPDDWLAREAKAFIKTAEHLQAEGVVPWRNIDSITESQKYDLEDEHDMRSSRWQRPIKGPGGIILHGVNGCGKTEIVRSWCVEIGATWYKIELSVEGKYRGQTVR